MSRPLVYVDTSAVHQGALEELKGAIDELVRFVEAGEPQLIAYNVYLNDDGSQVTVVHVHADSASLEDHMDVTEPMFRRLADLLTLSSIRVYGERSRTRARKRDEAVRGGAASAFRPVQRQRCRSHTSH